MTQENDDYPGFHTWIRDMDDSKSHEGLIDETSWEEIRTHYAQRYKSQQEFLETLRKHLTTAPTVDTRLQGDGTYFRQSNCKPS